MKRGELRVPLVYKTKPLFGFDIGSRTVKFVQLSGHADRPQITGYGYAGFQADSIIEGIISEPEAIAAAVKPAMEKPSAGRITAKRVALSLPVAKVFTRILQLPPMTSADLEQAVRFEAEQYVPVPINDLYIDYEVIQPIDAKASEHIDVLMVAAPRAIVDSYIKLLDLLNLEIDSIETGLTAIIRAMISAKRSNQTALVIDFGSSAADLAIFDQVIRVTGTVSVGGDTLTKELVEKLKITADQANEIKYKFGIGPSGLQAKIMEALAPQLHTLITETKRVLKYYQERSENKIPIENITLSGGSANMPGLIDYLYHELNVPIIIGNPWNNLETGSLPPADKHDAPMYTTAIGLALREARQ